MRSSSFLAAALALALAACRAPRPLAAGDFVVTPSYAILFRPYQTWTYHVAIGPAAPAAEANETSGEPDEAATSLVVKCKADKVVPFRGGVTSHIQCNLPQNIAEDTGAYPVEGVWMANESGLWHVHAGASPSLDNATLILRARPEEGHIDPDELTGDDEFAEVAKDGDAWCTTHRQHLDVDNSFTLCFGQEGIRSGRYGWTDAGEKTLHETRFELAR